MCQTHYQCVRHTINVSDTLSMCQTHYQCVRHTINVSDTLSMCQTHYQCVRHTINVSDTLQSTATTNASATVTADLASAAACFSGTLGTESCLTFPPFHPSPYLMRTFPPFHPSPYLRSKDGSKADVLEHRSHMVFRLV
jgi:hypothetical protein